MSQVEHILSEAMAQNVVLYLKDGQLTFANSGQRLSVELREKIVAHKASIIDYLKQLQATPGDANASVAPAATGNEPLAALLATLAEHDVQVYVEEGKLKTRSKPGAITPAIAAQLRDHKLALIAHLSAASAKPFESVPAPLVPEGEHGLSYAQQRLWFLDQFKSGNVSYNMPITLRLDGKLDSEALRRSLDEIVQRHAVLRSTYAKTPAGPVQTIQPAAPIALPIVDLRDLAEAEQGLAISRLARAEVERPFDLARDPMLRVALARLAEERYVLYVTLHHIAADGWSLGVLVKELVALYDTFTRALPPSLPPLSHQYVDYARWQQQFCKSEQIKRELTHWRDALAGIPPVHSLPLDKPRPTHQRAEGGVIHRQLDVPTLAALNKLAKQHKATLFMLLHAAFALLLGRWSNQSDIVIGTPVAGRYLPMTEPLIGFFINTLALRTQLHEDASFEQLLQQSKAFTLDAYEHQNVPFEMLVEALNPPRNLCYPPLFQVMFALQNYELGSLALPGLNIEVMQPEFALAKFDLAVMAMEGADGLAMSWVYADSLFEGGTIASMIDSFVTLLQAIADTPQCGIFQLPLLSAEQHAATISLARTSDDNQLALDRRGYLQPAGAWGELYALDRDVAIAAAPSQPLSPSLRSLGKTGRLRVDGRSEVCVPSEPSPPTERAVVAHVAPTHALERKLCDVWCTVLMKEAVGVHDNFFDIGGSSMQCVMLQQEIETQLGRDVSITDLFTYPTVASFARYLQGGEQALDESATPGREEGRDDIAVIGMAGRFPDAIDIDAFWENIKNGVESIRHYSDETLRAAGVSEALLSHPAYVKSGILLDDIEQFDAAYFGFTPREAEVTDPQQRLLFECAVEALENAGYGNDARPRSVGVQVGIGESRYLFEHLLPQSEQLENAFNAAMYGNRSDFVATRLSYRLNLCGPSMTVGTACSTSLVAVHNACVSLLNNECELALAGGASLLRITPQGYLYQEGSISSPDGHCRAFDHAAKGTRSGSGAGLVVLKRLSRALADGDTIHAVIKGSAVNNDGADKVGYTAPSVAGQAQVIREAQRVAGVTSDSIQYMEAHGTGTELGDPIEIKALTASLRYPASPILRTDLGKTQCRSFGYGGGSVAGLIKTVEALKHRQLPPSINYEAPNPKIDFDNSPFYVNTQLTEWESEGARRAGVSSFGIGGTNAHVVLEEAPISAPSHSHRATQLLLLSAKTETALQTMSTRLAAHLKRIDSPPLIDVAYTQQVGRARHAYRRAPPMRKYG